jgi:hypothetical protein
MVKVKETNKSVFAIKEQDEWEYNPSRAHVESMCSIEVDLTTLVHYNIILQSNFYN